MIVPLSGETAKYLQLKRADLSELIRKWTRKRSSDTLGGITDLHEMIAAVIRSAQDEALHFGLRGRARRHEAAVIAARAQGEQEARLGAGGHERGWFRQTRAARLYCNGPRRLPCPSSHLRANHPFRRIGCRSHPNSIAKGF